MLRYRQFAFMSASTSPMLAGEAEHLPEAPLSSEPGANAGLCGMCVIQPVREGSSLKLAAG